MSLTVTSRLKAKTLTLACLNLTISVMASSVYVILPPLIIYFVSSTNVAIYGSSFKFCKSVGGAGQNVTSPSAV